MVTVDYCLLIALWSAVSLLYLTYKTAVIENKQIQSRARTADRLLKNARETIEGQQFIVQCYREIGRQKEQI